MKIQAHGATDVGQVRKHNEDSFLCDPELGLYVVCDGMGGHAAGDFASQTACEIIRNYLHERRDILDAATRSERPTEDVATILSESIQKASSHIHELGRKDPGRKGMGTTCNALIIVGQKGVMGHVGDSRMYLTRSGQPYQLSEDHTFVAEAIRRGLMTPEQAAESSHRNVVTRAVGPNASVLVDTLVFDILPQDTFLLCSDGLHTYVNRSSELVAALAPDDLESVTTQLIDTANERGGNDNITALVVRVLAANTVEAENEKVRASQVTNDLSTLGHIVLFRELDMKELVKMSSAFRPIEFGADEVIVKEGEVADTLFVIMSGSTSVRRSDQELAVLKAGDHFGEMALLSRRPRTATVVTRKATRLLALERERFVEVVYRDHCIGSKILWRLAQTLSMRLDELYMLSDRDGLGRNSNRDTHAYGLFPSPFDPYNTSES